jgi:rubredoxin
LLTKNLTNQRPTPWRAFCTTQWGYNDTYIIIDITTKNLKTIETMKKYVCTACHYVYDPEVGDPENGVPAGTAWEDVPEDWACPLCGLGKDVFEVEE